MPPLYPTLMIVRSVPETEKGLRELGFMVFNVDSVAEAREAISELRGVPVRAPVALSDVSLLWRLQAVLLKFIEETSLDLVLVASQDNISSVVLSRMKRVVKDPKIIPHENDDPSNLIPLLRSEDDEVLVEDVIRGCPSMGEFMYRLKRARLPVKDKLVGLLAADG